MCAEGRAGEMSGLRSAFVCNLAESFVVKVTRVRRCTADDEPWLEHGRRLGEVVVVDPARVLVHVVAGRGKLYG